MVMNSLDATQAESVASMVLVENLIPISSPLIQLMGLYELISQVAKTFSLDFHSAQKFFI